MPLRNKITNRFLAIFLAGNLCLFQITPTAFAFASTDPATSIDPALNKTTPTMDVNTDTNPSPDAFDSSASTDETNSTTAMDGSNPDNLASRGPAISSVDETVNAIQTQDAAIVQGTSVMNLQTGNTVSVASTSTPAPVISSLAPPLNQAQGGMDANILDWNSSSDSTATGYNIYRRSYGNQIPVWRNAEGAAIGEDARAILIGLGYTPPNWQATEYVNRWYWQSPQGVPVQGIPNATMADAVLAATADYWRDYGWELVAEDHQGLRWIDTTVDSEVQYTYEVRVCQQATCAGMRADQLATTVSINLSANYQAAYEGFGAENVLVLVNRDAPNYVSLSSETPGIWRNSAGALDEDRTGSQILTALGYAHDQNAWKNPQGESVSGSTESILIDLGYQPIESLRQITETELLQYLGEDATAWQDSDADGRYVIAGWQVIKNQDGSIEVPLGLYYAMRREIPKENIVYLTNIPDRDWVPEAQWWGAYSQSRVIQPIANHLADPNGDGDRSDSILGRIVSIVSTGGFPLRVGGYDDASGKAKGSWEEMLNYDLWNYIGGNTREIVERGDLGRHFSRSLGDAGFLTTRIQSINAETARTNMIDNVLWAEDNYRFENSDWLEQSDLRAFVDWKGIYTSGDALFQTAGEIIDESEMFKGVNGSVLVNQIENVGRNADTDQDQNNRLDNTFLYTGWYHFNEAYVDLFDYARGAISWDLNSASADTLRNIDVCVQGTARVYCYGEGFTSGGSWAAHAIANGASVSLGSVAEPILTGHTLPQLFSYYLTRGYSVSEAAYYGSSGMRSQQAHMYTFAMDPLYTPIRLQTQSLRQPVEVNGETYQRQMLSEPLSKTGELDFFAFSAYRDYDSSGRLAREQLANGTQIEYFTDGRVAMLEQRPQSWNVSGTRLSVFDAQGHLMSETQVSSFVSELNMSLSSRKWDHDEIRMTAGSVYVYRSYLNKTEPDIFDAQGFLVGFNERGEVVQRSLVAQPVFIAEGADPNVRYPVIGMFNSPAANPTSFRYENGTTAELEYQAGTNQISALTLRDASGQVAVRANLSETGKFVVKDADTDEVMSVISSSDLKEILIQSQAAQALKLFRDTMMEYLALTEKISIDEARGRVAYEESSNLRSSNGMFYLYLKINNANGAFDHNVSFYAPLREYHSDLELVEASDSRGFDTVGSVLLAFQSGRFLLKDHVVMNEAQDDYAVQSSFFESADGRAVYMQENGSVYQLSRTTGEVQLVYPPLVTAVGTVTTAGTVVQFTAVTDATGYEVEISRNADFSTTLELQNHYVTTNQFALPDFSAGTFYFRVRAVHGTGDQQIRMTGWSASQQFTMNVTRSAYLTPLSYAQGGVDANVIDWSALNDTEITGYQVYRRVYGGSDYEAIAIVTDMSRYIDTGIQADTAYQYEVRAIKGGSELNTWIQVNQAANYDQAYQGLQPANVLVLVRTEQPGWVDISEEVEDYENAGGRLDPITEAELLNYLSRQASDWRDADSNGISYLFDEDGNVLARRDTSGIIEVPMGVYYAYRRDIPPVNIVFIDLGGQWLAERDLTRQFGDMSSADFTRLVVNPIHTYLVNHNLVSTITSIVSTYHFPLVVDTDPTHASSGYGRDLQSWEYHLSYGLWNSFGGTDEQMIQRTNLGRSFSRFLGDGGYLTTRIDAADEIQARRTIDDALWAESNYHFGQLNWNNPGIRAFYDTHGLGDHTFLNALRILEDSGLFGSRGEFWDSANDLTADFIRTHPGYDLDQDGQLDATFLYMGWYHFEDVYTDIYNYARGAISWDLNSASADSIRNTGTGTGFDPSGSWASYAIANGAAFSLGAVSEPYLTGITDPALFTYYLTQGYSFAETAHMSISAPMMTFAGDPLYRPFGGVGDRRQNLIVDGQPVIREILASPNYGDSLYGHRMGFSASGESTFFTSFMAFRDYDVSGHLVGEQLAEGQLIRYLDDGRTVVLDFRQNVTAHNTGMNTLRIHDASGAVIFEGLIPGASTDYDHDEIRVMDDGSIRVYRYLQQQQNPVIFDINGFVLETDPVSGDVTEVRCVRLAVVNRGTSQAPIYQSTYEMLGAVTYGDEVIGGVSSRVVRRITEAAGSYYEFRYQSDPHTASGITYRGSSGEVLVSATLSPNGETYELSSPQTSFTMNFINGSRMSIPETILAIQRMRTNFIATHFNYLVEYLRMQEGVSFDYIATQFSMNLVGSPNLMNYSMVRRLAGSEITYNFSLQTDGVISVSNQSWYASFSQDGRVNLVTLLGAFPLQRQNFYYDAENNLIGYRQGISGRTDFIFYAWDEVAGRFCLAVEFSASKVAAIYFGEEARGFRSVGDARWFLELYKPVGVIFHASLDTQWNGETNQLQITGADNFETFEVQVARDEGFTDIAFEGVFPEAPISLNALAEGNYFLRIRGVLHYSENGTIKPVTSEWSAPSALDNQPPRIEVTSTVPALTNQQTLTVTYRVDGGAEQTQVFNLVEGNNAELTITAADAARNTTAHVLLNVRFEVQPINPPSVVNPPVVSAIGIVTTAGTAVQFTAVTGATGYEVEISRSADFSTTLELQNYYVTTNQFTLPDFSAGTFYFRVRAVNGEVGSQTPMAQWAPGQSFTMNVSYSPLMTPLSYAQGGTDVNILDWFAPLNDGNQTTTYNIYRRILGADSVWRDSLGQEIHVTPSQLLLSLGYTQANTTAQWLDPQGSPATNCHMGPGSCTNADNVIRALGYWRDYGWELVQADFHGTRYFDSAIDTGVSYQYEVRACTQASCAGQDAHLLPDTISVNRGANYDAAYQSLQPENVLVLVRADAYGYVDVSTTIEGYETANGHLDPISEASLLSYLGRTSSDWQDADQDGTSYVLDANGNVLARKDSTGKIEVPLGVYYSYRRNIPLENIVFLDFGGQFLGEHEDMGDANFEQLVVNPIHTYLVEHNLAARISSIVSMYHFPLIRTQSASGHHQGTAHSWEETLNYSLWQRFSPNLDAPYGSNEDMLDRADRGRHFSRLLGDAGYLVTRMDAADAHTVRTNMIDNAIYAEQNFLHQGADWIRNAGLQAFIDWQGAHAEGDGWFQQAADILDDSGLFGPDQWESVPDLNAFLQAHPEYDQDHDGKLDATFLYTGWYNFNNAYNDIFNYARGALSWDLNSASADTLRNTSGGGGFGSGGSWASYAISLGAAASLGSVAEPFLAGHTRPQQFISYLLQGYSFAEAGYYASFSAVWNGLISDDYHYNVSPWNYTFNGDPLYSPFTTQTQSAFEHLTIHGQEVARVTLQNPLETSSVRAIVTPTGTLDQYNYSAYRDYDPQGRIVREQLSNGTLIEYLPDGRTVIYEMGQNGLSGWDNELYGDGSSSRASTGRLYVYDANGQVLLQGSIPTFDRDTFRSDEIRIVEGAIYIYRSYADNTRVDIFNQDGLLMNADPATNPSSAAHFALFTVTGSQSSYRDLGQGIYGMHTVDGETRSVVMRINYADGSYAVIHYEESSFGISGAEVYDQTGAVTIRVEQDRSDGSFVFRDVASGQVMIKAFGDDITLFAHMLDAAIQYQRYHDIVVQYLQITNGLSRQAILERLVYSFGTGATYEVVGSIGSRYYFAFRSSDPTPAWGYFTVTRNVRTGMVAISSPSNSQINLNSQFQMISEKINGVLLREFLHSGGALLGYHEISGGIQTFYAWDASAQVRRLAAETVGGRRVIYVGYPDRGFRTLAEAEAYRAAINDPSAIIQQPPVIALIGSIPSLTNQTVFTVRYSVDGVEQTNPATFQLREGVNSGLQVIVRDEQQRVLATYDLPAITLDSTAPVISAVTTSGITATGLTLAWMTNEASNTQIEYGLTSSYGQSTVLEPALVTNHTQVLSGLQSSTTYHYRVLSRDAAGNLQVSGDYTFTTVAPPDTTAPVISAVTTSGVTATGLTIAWMTNEASNTQIEYGLTSSYGQSTVLEPALVTNHAQVLSGLQSSTTYHYRVLSRDAAGNLQVSGDYTFTTVAPPDTTAPVITIPEDLDGSFTNQASFLVRYTVDGEVRSRVFTLSDANDGVNHLSLTAVDEAGNERTINFTVTLDTTDPVIVITSTIPESTSMPFIAVTYTVDGGEDQTIVLPLAEGENRDLKIRGMDRAGNLSVLTLQAVTYIKPNLGQALWIPSGMGDAPVENRPATAQTAAPTIINASQFMSYISGLGMSYNQTMNTYAQISQIGAGAAVYRYDGPTGTFFTWTNSTGRSFVFSFENSTLLFGEILTPILSSSWY